MLTANTIIKQRYRSFCLTAVLLSLLYCCASHNNPVEEVDVQPVDLVYPHIDAVNSRWFFFSSASRPFGIVNLSPEVAQPYRD